METGRVKLVENTDEGVDVQCNVGGTENVTAGHYGPPGDDSRPLPGDDAALVGAPGAGNRQAVGYADGKNPSLAANGEVRRYSRAPTGTLVAEIWLKSNGEVSIRSATSGGVFTIDPVTGTVEINGVTIDKLGNLSAPGQVTAMTAAVPVNLATHVHPTAALGSPSPPTPGT